MGPGLRRRPQGLGAVGERRRRHRAGEPSSSGIVARRQTPVARAGAHGGCVFPAAGYWRLRLATPRRQPPSGPADGPLARPGAGVEQRGAAILLGLRRRSGVALAADGGPGAHVELVLATVGAAATDRAGIAVRLTLGDLLELRRDRVRAPFTLGCGVAQHALGVLPLLVQRRTVDELVALERLIVVSGRECGMHAHDAYGQHAGY